MTYAFTFDASSCSGCKACQAACKDKNQLPVGVLWRRVYEVNGGGWEQRGGAWTNTVFAYNLSMACNHCEHPKCAGVCPVDAYVIRPDGIVYIDESKCVGCGYCAWACPYGAPQYNPALGHMTKCNFCFDNIDTGLPPACVAACPLRVLGVTEIGEQRVESSSLELWNVSAEEHPFPLPTYSRTQPHLAIKPHKAMSVAETKYLANHEEIHPRKESAWEEAPLVIFTLLAQLSVGAFWFANLLFTKPLTILPLSMIGFSLGIGMFTSFAHLGTKKNAWRVLGHLRKSWLSREILFESLFGVGWLSATAALVIFHRSIPSLNWITAALGFVLIYSMSQVYRLPAKPKWNTWLTNASFFVSALTLGLTSTAAVAAYEASRVGLAASFWNILCLDVALLICVLIVFQTWIASSFHASTSTRSVHFAINALAILTTTFVFILAAQPTVSGSLAVFLLVAIGEAIGRWQFYKAE